MHDKLTESDIRKMEEEIEHRKLVVRPKALEDLKVARAQGDLSENFEYYAAKRFKNQNESRIRYLENMIKTARVEYLDDHSTQELKIVTTVRANSLGGYITPESPVGKALIGHKVGDTVHVRVNDAVQYDVKIIKLENTDDTGDTINSY